MRAGASTVACICTPFAGTIIGQRFVRAGFELIPHLAQEYGAVHGVGSMPLLDAACVCLASNGRSPSAITAHARAIWSWARCKARIWGDACATGSPARAAR